MGDPSSLNLKHETLRFSNESLSTVSIINLIAFPSDLYEKKSFSSLKHFKLLCERSLKSLTE